MKSTEHVHKWEMCQETTHIICACGKRAGVEYIISGLNDYESIKQTAGELALQLWDATPPNEISKENATLKREIEASNRMIEYLNSQLPEEKRMIRPPAAAGNDLDSQPPDDYGSPYDDP